MTRASALQYFGLLTSVLYQLMSVNPCLAEAQGAVDFDRDVKPILSSRCYACHGPDAATRKADLRLDRKDGLFGKLDEGPCVAPGDPKGSALFRRVVSKDLTERMPPPPKDDGKDQPLTAAQISVLSRWISEGATWQSHWSLKPIPAQATFDGTKNAWARNFIDQHVAKRHQQDGLAPATEADPRTWLRRVALDLTGLPPKPHELQLFLNDRRPMAYERAVDRLLASTEYAEHMARQWLDLARYGDTHGLHRDEKRSLWPYRDWVIQAFKSNMPFDQFTTKQLAGDLLPNATESDRIATGFVRANVSTSEGGAIGDEFLARYAADRAEATATTWLGLTVGCATCHDHKYDPITQKDFYSLTAYFRGIDEFAMDENRERVPPFLILPTQAQKKKLGDLETKIAQLSKQLESPQPKWDRAQTEWESTSVSKTNTLRMSPWSSLGCIGWGSAHESLGRGIELEGHPIDLAKSWTSKGRSYSWTARPEWTDATMIADLQGDLCATYLFRVITSPDARTLTLSLGAKDGLKVWVNEKQLLETLTFQTATADQIKLKVDLKAGRNEIVLKVANQRGMAQFFFAPNAPDDDVEIQSDTMSSLIAIPRNKRNEMQVKALRGYYRLVISKDLTLIKLRESLADTRKQWRALEKELPATLVAAERPEPRPTYVLDRGQYDQPKEQVWPNTPVALPPLPPTAPRNRLGLAQWLLSDTNPLTARVVVNRYWQQFFGVGLVKTSEDFGAQGERPMHATLLDDLAVRFRDNGWNIKELMRWIVTSSTYRQSSIGDAESWKRDPENRLLARGPRGRLDAETLRDQALAVSGLLVEKTGGPSVRPPQPAGLWEEVSIPGANTSVFVAESGEAAHRRSLYTFIKRTAPPPTMQIFDAPSRESCTSRRERTNTPTQALALLNEPQFVQAAAALAQKAAKAGKADDKWIESIFETALLRKPAPKEKEALESLFKEEERQHGKTKALFSVANVIMNLDEFVSKE